VKRSTLAPNSIVLDYLQLRVQKVARGISRRGRAVSTLGTEHKENKTRSRDLDKNLARGDDFVARFISGAALGGFAGGVFTGGSGIVPGAVVGGVVGTVVPSALSAIRRTNNGRKS
jgi:hypothetical protein